MNEPLVGIIVLHWSGLAKTSRCLKSLQDSQYPNVQIYLVDNGSPDQGGTKLQAEFKDTVHFIQNGANLGFAGGNNVGIKQALADGCDFVLIINNDTVVKPDFLNRLVDTALSDSKIGMIGPKILSAEPSNRIWFAGGRLHWNSGVRIGHVGVGETDRGQYDAAGKTDWLTGCCLLVRRAVIDKIGLLPEAYFLYFEDVDWSAAAQRAGWRLVYEPRSVIWHSEASEAQLVRPQKLYYQARNYPMLVRRYANWHQRMTFGLFFFVYYSQLLIRNLLTGKLKANNMFWRGIRDYFRGRTGPGEAK